VLDTWDMPAIAMAIVLFVSCLEGRVSVWRMIAGNRRQIRCGDPLDVVPETTDQRRHEQHPTQRYRHSLNHDGNSGPTPQRGWLVRGLFYARADNRGEIRSEASSSLTIPEILPPASISISP
jgi:hypothetical protein